jgi:hypothetical protein
MSRHVETGAMSHVLKLRTRLESRMGMRYSTNALDRFHYTHTHTYKQTTTASSHFL